MEKQLQDAQQRAQEAEKGRTKAEVQGEALAARMEALESRKAKQREEDQGQLPLGE
jgi:chromosome segregation ATPase